MKVITVSTYDVKGGAARAAYRLHTALGHAGMDTAMLVQDREGPDGGLLGPDSALGKAMGIVRPTLDLWPVNRYKHRKPIMFSPAWLPFTGLPRRLNSSDADVVHLHWVAGGMMRIEDLAAIEKPIVWSLHDMWAYTGGCHIDAGCGRYQQHCGACPVLGSQREHDLSHRVFERKRRTLEKVKNITIVGLSRWMADNARKSALFGQLPVVNIPNPIDTGVFQPIERAAARALLGLPAEARLLLFGGYKATADPNKGFAELATALGLIRDANVELMVMGAMRPAQPPDLGSPTPYMGHYHDDLAMAILYNAADVVIVPSRQENLSNTIMESMACGTPVVAFDIGGNKDMIDPLVNGWLAKPQDAQDLAAGIRWALEPARRPDLRRAAREKVLAEFEQAKVAARYRQLYEEVVKH